MLFKNKNGEEIEIPSIPEPERQVTYKLTVTKVTKVKTAKTKTVYFGPEKQIIQDWSAYYNLSDEKKEKFKEIQVPTADYESNTHSEELYSQEKNDLDIADMAMYINRAK